MSNIHQSQISLLIMLIGVNSAIDLSHSDAAG